MAICCRHRSRLCCSTWCPPTSIIRIALFYLHFYWAQGSSLSPINCCQKFGTCHNSSKTWSHSFKWVVVYFYVIVHSFKLAYDSCGLSRKWKYAHCKSELNNLFSFFKFNSKNSLKIIQSWVDSHNTWCSYLPNGSTHSLTISATSVSWRSSKTSHKSRFKSIPPFVQMSHNCYRISSQSCSRSRSTKSRWKSWTVPMRSTQSARRPLMDCNNKYPFIQITVIRAAAHPTAQLCQRYSIRMTFPRFAHRRFN